MASSKVMASTPPSNPDLPRQSSTHFIDHSKSFGSINMDEILNNIYADADAFPASVNDNGGDGCGGGVPLQKNEGNKTVDEVWKEIVAGREPEMTLEDFLTKAGAVSEEEVRIPVMQPPSLGFAPDAMMTAVQFQAALPLLQNGPGGLGGSRGGGVGRGKRRAVEEPPMDKATQQKQRRMIKNRESAARSRERKQAYTVELEALVTQLEEENAKLLREEAEESKKRFKLLMENLIPVEEKRKPPRKRTLGRSNSM